MVIMIGGSSHVGKTLLAQKLVKKLNYSCLSLDHLKMGLIRAGITNLTVEQDYEMRYYLWPIVAEMIKTAIENDQNLIIEGCYIPGEWQDSFTDEYLEKIRCIFIVMSEEYLREKFDDVKNYASVIEKRLDDNPDLERLIMCSKEFKKDCLEHGISCLEIIKDYNPDKIIKLMLEMWGL